MKNFAYKNLKTCKFFSIPRNNRVIFIMALGMDRINQIQDEIFAKFSYKRITLHRIFSRGRGYQWTNQPSFQHGLLCALETKIS